MASVFICYAREDNSPRRTRWLNEVRVHLAPFVRHDEMTVWSDQDIEPGQQWDKEIAAQLQTARVAVLLISPDFLASQYIANSELPVLLKRAHVGGVTILPLLLRPSAYEYARFKWPDPKQGPHELTLSSIQAVGSGSETLSELPRPKWERVLVDLGKRIRDILDAQPPMPPPPTAPEERVRISISHLPSAGTYLVGRENELTRLRQSWESPNEHVLTIIGRGGEGKSNLVRHWLNDMAGHEWRDANRVYGWSFYSQGTNDKAANADQFMDQALRFFGESEPERFKSADARGERLAELVGAGRNLLILDGLEPLQYPPGPMHGRLKDPGLHTLITGLVAKNRGLCVITTREHLPDLASTRHSLSPEIELPPLTPDAGARLLGNLGVTGSDAERASVAAKLGGHAFSIHLLGTYLAEVHGGDIARAGEVALLEGTPDSRRHALHLLASYEKWLSGATLAEADLPPQEAAEAKQTGAEMLAVLRLLGLFDRPATIDAINALREAPAIPGLTEPLVSLSPPEWQRTLARLRNLQLIDHDLGDPETIDAHPLLREYFAEQLEKVPESAIEAHRRLYEHFKSAAPDLPETLRDMTPLFQAVVHGCKAEKWQEVFTSFAAFFSHPWPMLAISFSSSAAHILSSVGFYLGAVGRFNETTEPLLRALRAYSSEQQWKKARIPADNLSVIHLTLGNVAAAVAYAEQVLEFAVRTEDKQAIAIAANTVGDALHAAGTVQDASRAFAEFDAGTDAGELILSEFTEFRHTDHLLHVAISVPADLPDRRKVLGEIASRNERHLEKVEAGQFSLWCRALARLSTGRTYALLSANLSRARQLFDEAIALLREATKVNFLATGLVWRAEFARMTGDPETAERDLTEAELLSDRHGMLRWQIECAVERAWFRHAFGGDVREKLAEAKALIRRTEKPYVPYVWTFEEQEPPPYIGVFKEGDIVGYYRCNDSIAELEGLQNA